MEVTEVAKDGAQPAGTRKATALVVGLVGALGYIWLAVTVADWVVPLHWSIGLVYFGVVGVAWAWPAARLLRWAFAAPAKGRGGG